MLRRAKFATFRRRKRDRLLIGGGSRTSRDAFAVLLFRVVDIQSSGDLGLGCRVGVQARKGGDACRAPKKALPPREYGLVLMRFRRPQ